MLFSDGSIPILLFCVGSENKSSFFTVKFAVEVRDPEAGDPEARDPEEGNPEETDPEKPPQEPLPGEETEPDAGKVGTA